MFPYNIVEDQAKELIHACAEKSIGFIAMKPLAGGAIEDAVTALRCVCANPDVTVVIPGMADIAELIVTSPEKVLFKQLQVLPTVEIDNF